MHSDSIRKERKLENMESLKGLSWQVVKKVVKEEEKVRSFKEIRKEIKNKEDRRQVAKVEKVAEEVGWIDVCTRQWKIEVKKEMWKEVHRDIVSTK